MGSRRSSSKKARDLTGDLFSHLDAPQAPEIHADSGKTLFEGAAIRRDEQTGQRYFTPELTTLNPPKSYTELAERFEASHILDATQFFDETHPSLGEGCLESWKNYVIELSRRQLQGIDVFLQSTGKLLLQANTGKGKTPMALAALGVEFTKQPYNSLLVPRHVLASQSIERIEQFLPGVEVISVGRKSVKQREKLYTKLAEDLAKPNPPKRLLLFTEVLANDLEQRLDPALIGTLVVDEAHKSIGKASYARVAEAMKETPNHTLLLTATPGRTPEEVDALCDKWGVNARWSMKLPNEPKLHNVHEVALTPHSKSAIESLEKALYSAVVRLGKGLPEIDLPAKTTENLKKFFGFAPKTSKEWLRGLFFRANAHKSGERIIAGNYRFYIPSLKALSDFTSYTRDRFQAEVLANVPSSEREWPASASRAIEVGYLHYLLGACVSSGEFAALGTMQKLEADALKALAEGEQIAHWKRRLLLSKDGTIDSSPKKVLGKVFHSVQERYRTLKDLQKEIEIADSGSEKQKLEQSALNLMVDSFPKIGECLDILATNLRVHEGGVLIRTNLISTAMLLHEAIQYDPRLQNLGISADVAIGGRAYQSATNRARKNFVAGKTNVLVATSVIDEGLDTPALLGILVEPQPEAKVNTQFEGRISRPNFEGKESMLLGEIVTLVSEHPIDKRKLRSAKRGVASIQKTNSEI